MFELIIAGFAILLLSVFIKNSRLGHGSLPPGPTPLPIIGHFHLLGPLIHHSFRDLSSSYGSLIYLRLGSVPCVVASTPELAKELLKTNDLTFSSRMHSLAIDHLTYNSSLAFSPYGPYWRFIKKMSTFEFLGNRALNQFLPIRRKELREFLGVLHDKSKVCDSVNVTEELLKLSSNIISQIILSLRCSGTDNEAEGTWTFRGIEGNLRMSIEGMMHWWRKLSRNREIERKNKSSGGEYKARDLLDMMLDAMEDKSSEVELTRENIKALVLDFITAATDTTATATEWALAELINNPKVLAKAQQEIDTVVGNKRLVEESDSPNLPYIQAIIKETFRLHPPVPMISRKSIQESKIKGYTIPQDTLLFVNWNVVDSSDAVKIKGNAARPVDMTERPGLTAPRFHELVCAPVPRPALDSLQL
ncbi:hypothetical protein OIU77_003947 [Salix suchowensis]|uniref:Flavone synthase II n=1 Tax=Salix suchowensis TaxID=1278906 RepID=A0ABQ9AUG4_9ROSI|nr:hypothetical protein OIU77_003947 [Salix suchowensis]